MAAVLKMVNFSIEAYVESVYTMVLFGNETEFPCYVYLQKRLVFLLICRDSLVSTVSKKILDGDPPSFVS